MVSQRLGEIGCNQELVCTSCAILICTGPVIVRDMRRGRSFVGTTDDFLCADVRREAFVDGSFCYFFQCGECELGPVNANTPPQSMIGKYLKNIVVLMHGTPCLAEAMP